jgi:hypothetical protein
LGITEISVKETENHSKVYGNYYELFRKTVSRRHLSPNLRGVWLSNISIHFVDSFYGGVCSFVK